MTEIPEKKEKILYMVTKAGENAEMVLLPFMHAVGALAMDVEAVVVLMSNAVWLAKKDYARHVRFPDKPPLDELMRNFIELGGKLLLCTPCAKARDLGEDAFVEGAELVAAARFTEEVLTSTSTLSY